MDTYQRHRITWRVLYALVSPWLCPMFNLSHEDLHLDGPCVIVPNHTNAWDPLFVAMSLRDKQVYFVASEHLFRQGLISWILGKLVAPISRSKASSGTDTVKACLRHLKSGHSVCLFAEGEQCWDGRTTPIFPATGKLIKVSGASLVTFRVEGGYLSKPRWAYSLRRGRIHVGPVRIYSPQALREMSAAEVNAAIQRDISEDAWQRRKAHPVAFRGRRRAEGLERALFLCPNCGSMGTLRSSANRLFCKCGLSVTYAVDGSFVPSVPFPTLAEWDAWQHDQLRCRAFPHDELLFSDEKLRLTRIEAGHREKPVGCGRLEQYEERLVCAGHSFRLADVDNMAMVQANLLLLSCQGQYWQIRAGGRINLRKYLAIWREKKA